jgi:O-methyltransferase domain
VPPRDVEGGQAASRRSTHPPGNEPHFGKSLDLTMLVLLGGRERTEAEYRTLLDAAGFGLTNVVPTRSPVSIIEGRPTEGSGKD